MIKNNKAFWGSVVSLALPIAMQNLLTSCASLIDTAMITPLGDSSISGVGVAARFTFLLNVMAFGFCSGAATLISQFWGVNDRKGIHRTYGLALSSSMVLAIIFALIIGIFPETCVSLFGPEEDAAIKAVEYLKILAFAVPFIMFSQVTCAALRATEKVLVPLASSMVSVVVNVFFNYCLIGGNLGFPRLEVRGAALATAVGTVTQAIIVFLFLVFSRNPIRASIRELFGFSKRFALKFVKTAAPVFFNETMWACGTNIYVMVLARQGNAQYAGYSVYETVQQLFFVFFVGICHASAIMVGKAVGRGDSDEAFTVAKRFLIMTPLAGVALGAIIILVRYPLLTLFSFETELARETCASLLLFYGFWLGIRMIPYTAVCGIFRAGGDTRIGCIFEIGALYLCGIPLVSVAGLLLKLPFIWIVATMFMAEDIPKGILCVRYFFKKKWIRRLTDKTT